LSQVRHKWVQEVVVSFQLLRHSTIIIQRATTTQVVQVVSQVNSFLQGCHFDILKSKRWKLERSSCSCKIKRKNKKKKTMRVISRNKNYKCLGLTSMDRIEGVKLLMDKDNFMEKVNQMRTRQLKATET